MATEKSYYEVLGVRAQATAHEIRQAFKQIVIVKHPDRGGNEEEFVLVQKAYEVLSDARRRRIYDHYGARGLEQSAEALFMQDFRGGSFARDEKDLEKEVSNLRKENESLQRTLMLVKPETASTFANSFEAWLRNRDPNQTKTLTSKDLMDMLGVAEGTYEPVRLPELRGTVAQYTADGDLHTAVTAKTETAPESLGWGEVLVHMLAAPVTTLDRHIARWGFIPGEERKTVDLPSVAGSEGVGMVVCVGPGVERLAVHDLVLPKEPGLGTWRKFGVFRESKLFRVPPTTASPEALAHFFSYCTAYRLLHDFGSLKPGDTIVQSSPESAIGQTIILLAKLLQIKTINLLDERPDFEVLSDVLAGKGATHVWKNTGSVLERVQRTRLALPRLGIDDRGGATLTRIAESLRPDSTLALYGGQSSKLESFPYSALLYSDLEIRGFWLYRRLRAHPEDFANLPHLLLPLLEQGKIDIDVSPWERLDESFRDALADTKPNILLRFGTLEEATALAKDLAHVSQAPVGDAAKATDPRASAMGPVVTN